MKRVRKYYGLTIRKLVNTWTAVGLNVVPPVQAVARPRAMT
jgi:hypothetical protein